MYETPDDAARDNNFPLIEFLSGAVEDPVEQSMVWLAAHPAWRNSKPGQTYLAFVANRFQQQFDTSFGDAPDQAQMTPNNQSRSNEQVLKILQAAGADDALRVRLMYLNRAFRLSDAPCGDAGLPVIAALLHIQDVLGDAAVSIADIASVIWYDANPEQLSALLQPARDAASLKQFKNETAQVYNILKNSHNKESQTAYYNIIPLISTLASDLELIQGAKDLCAALTSALNTEDTESHLTLENVVSFFGIAPRAMGLSQTLESSFETPEIPANTYDAFIEEAIRQESEDIGFPQEIAKEDLEDRSSLQKLAEDFSIDDALTKLSGIVKEGEHIQDFLKQIQPREPVEQLNGDIGPPVLSNPLSTTIEPTQDDLNAEEQSITDAAAKDAAAALRPRNELDMLVRDQQPEAVYEIGSSVFADMQLASIGWLASHPALRFTPEGKTYLSELRKCSMRFDAGDHEENLTPALNQVLDEMLNVDVVPVEPTPGVRTLLHKAIEDAALRLHLLYLYRVVSPDVLLRPGAEEIGFITAGAVLHLASSSVTVLDVLTVLWPIVPQDKLVAFSQSTIFNNPSTLLHKSYAETAYQALNDESKPKLLLAYYNFLDPVLEFGPSRTMEQTQALIQQIDIIITECQASGIQNIDQIVKSLGIIARQPLRGKERDGSRFLEATAPPISSPDKREQLRRSISVNVLQRASDATTPNPLQAPGITAPPQIKDSENTPYADAPLGADVAVNNSAQAPEETEAPPIMQRQQPFNEQVQPTETLIVAQDARITAKPDAIANKMQDHANSDGLEKRQTAEDVPNNPLSTTIQPKSDNLQVNRGDALQSPQHADAQWAYNMLESQVNPDDRATLRNWALRASEAPEHTILADVLPDERPALERICDAVRGLPREISPQCKFVALLQLSGFEKTYTRPRDPELLVIDMLIGGQLGPKMFLLQRIKWLFSTETAPLWRQTKHFIDTALKTSPTWQTAAHLVGEGKIQEYFGVRAQDAPRVTHPTRMSAFVNHVSENPELLRDFWNLAHKMQAAEISAEQAREVHRSLTDFAVKINLDDVEDVRDMACLLATGYQTVTQWERRRVATQRTFENSNELEHVRDSSVHMLELLPADNTPDGLLTPGIPAQTAKGFNTELPIKLPRREQLLLEYTQNADAEPLANGSFVGPGNPAIPGSNPTQEPGPSDRPEFTKSVGKGASPNQLTRLDSLVEEQQQIAPQTSHELNAEDDLAIPAAPMEQKEANDQSPITSATVQASADQQAHFAPPGVRDPLDLERVDAADVSSFNVPSPQNTPHDGLIDATIPGSNSTQEAAPNDRLESRELNMQDPLQPIKVGPKSVASPNPWARLDLLAEEQPQTTEQRSHEPKDKLDREEPKSELGQSIQQEKLEANLQELDDLLARLERESGSTTNGPQTGPGNPTIETQNGEPAHQSATGAKRKRHSISKLSRKAPRLGEPTQVPADGADQHAELAYQRPSSQVTQAPAPQPPVQQPNAQQQPSAQQQPNTQPPAQQPSAQQPPAQRPNAQQPPAQRPNAQQPPVQQPQAQQPPALRPNAQQPNAQQPNVAAPGRTKTSALSPNARAMSLLSALTPTPYSDVAGIKFYGKGDFREEHFTGDYEVISWCTKQPSRLARFYGTPAKHYVLVKSVDPPNAPLEAFPADMFMAHMESPGPLAKDEVVRVLPCDKDRHRPEGAFIVRHPAAPTMRRGIPLPPPNAVLRSFFGPNGTTVMPNDEAREEDRDWGLLANAFDAARSVNGQYDLESANQLHQISGEKFEAFRLAVQERFQPPRILPRLLHQRFLMRKIRQLIGALVRHEERLQGEPLLEGLAEYNGYVKRRWDPEKHPAEIKTGEIIGKKHRGVILRVGDTVYKAKTTDVFAQCRFTGVVPGDLTAGALQVQAHGAPRLNVQFKKNPEGKGCFIYTPQLDRFVTGYSTPGKRIRMTLKVLPPFDRTPAVFYDYPKGNDAMFTGTNAPLCVVGKMRQNHKDYVVVYNQKSQRYEAFDGRYVLDELLSTAKLAPADQRLQEGQNVYFARDPGGRTCMVRIHENGLGQRQQRQDAAYTTLTAGLQNYPASGSVLMDAPPPGQYTVMYQDKNLKRIVLVDNDRKGVAVPRDYFVKQHLEHGGLLDASLQPGAKITFSHTNGVVTATAWQAPQPQVGRTRPGQQLEP